MPRTMLMGGRHNAHPTSAPSDDLGLDLVPWEGGPAYYEQFAKADAAGWSDPTFFPFAVWIGKPDGGDHPGQFAAIGVNVYMAVEHNPPLTAATAEGIHVMPQMEEWTTGEVGSNALAVSWFIADEPDMNESFGDENGRLAEVQDRVSDVVALADGRFTSMNIGNGVNRTFWSPNTVDNMVQAVDLCCVDQYCYTSPGVRSNVESSPDWPGGSAHCAAAYGWLADQMYSFQGATRKPFWVAVETKVPYLAESGSDIILYAEIEGAVWASIIHEARGILWFQHNGFYPPDGDAPETDPNTGVVTIQNTYSILDCEQTLTDYVEDIMARVRNVAAVINTQSFVFDWQATGIYTMTKIAGGFIYCFAHVAIGGATGSKIFTLPAGVSGSTAEVVNESRSVNIMSGEFDDTFAEEYSHHIYKISI